MMKKDNLDRDMLSELIELLKKNGFNNFYFKNELLEIKGEFYNTIKHKEIINDEITVNKGIDNKESREVIVKSKYVARIKLENEKNIKFVETGDNVKKGKKIAEYEYLNIIFDLNSPCDGIIKEIYINHNDIVDYDKNLFLINAY